MNEQTKHNLKLMGVGVVVGTAAGLLAPTTTFIIKGLTAMVVSMIVTYVLLMRWGRRGPR